VIDAQGLFKSALIARLAGGTRYGLDWASSREPLALFYERTFSIPRSLHAVERNRRLAAQALHYELRPPVDYGIGPGHAFPLGARPGWGWLPTSEYCVLLHATSAARKLWPEAHWVALGRLLAERGLVCVLPWGSEAERSRSERIAAQLDGALTPPGLPLADVAILLGAARCAVGVDTGLSHLACALGVPTVAIYVDTDPALTGLYGCARGMNVGGKPAAPQVGEVLAALERVRA
jgi:heptosyltransferase-1